MRKKLLLACLLTLVSSASWALGVSDIDGVIGSEWTNYTASGQFTNSTGAVDYLWNTDANYVYGAFHMNVATPASYLSFANVYVYTGSAFPGESYGDGNDVILENGWMFSKDGSDGTWAGPAHGNRVLNSNTGMYEIIDQDAGVYYFYNNNTVEFAISKSLVGDKAQYKTGGQLWSYDQTYDVVPGSPAVPEPASIMLGIMGLGGVAGFRRFRSK